MKLFDLFRKPRQENKKLVLPAIYQSIITEDEYNFVVDIAVKYHTDKGITVTNISEGEIVTNVNGEVQRRYLDNLVRTLAGNDKSGWKEIIYGHFNKLVEHKEAYNYLFKDFDYTAQFLRVLIKSDEISIAGLDISDFIFRTDFPDTYTFLVIEFEEQFRYLKKDDVLDWGLTLQELFDIAISNTPSDEIQIQEAEFADKFPVYIFLSGDYSASLTLDLSNRADFSIGRFGSLIAIPAKGTAFTHPIENLDIIELITALKPTVQAMFDEEPGNITPNFYWQYNNQVRLITVVQNENGNTIKLPTELINLFEQEF